MAGGRSSHDEDLGPLHARGPKIIDGEFTVVHGPLPVQQTESDAFMAGLTMGPKYKPRWEHRGPGYKLTWKERGMYIIWGPPLCAFFIIGAVAVYQGITHH